MVRFHSNLFTLLGLNLPRQYHPFKLTGWAQTTLFITAAKRPLVISWDYLFTGELLVEYVTNLGLVGLEKNNSQSETGWWQNHAVGMLIRNQTVGSFKSLQPKAG